MTDRKKNIILSSILILFIVSSWIIYWVVILQNPNLKSWSERGTFGDMFGALNTLFSGLAFGGLIYAIFLQSRELGLQRLELSQTKEELAGQREQFMRQNFLTDYYNIINFITSHSNSVKLREKTAQGILQEDGLNTFDILLTIYIENYYNLYNDIVNENMRTKKAFNEFFQTYNTYLSPLIVALARLVELINRYNSEDKEYYLLLIDSMFSMSQKKIFKFYSIASVDDYLSKNIKLVIKLD